MDFSSRKVTRIPLEELWRNRGVVAGSRRRWLDANDISELLRDGRIQFVFADVGHPLQWIAPHDCYDFWKAEVKPHLAEADSRIRLDSFPGAYCYRASQWDDAAPQVPVVLLERQH